MIVNGTGFAPTAIVNWNGSPRITKSVSSQRLKARIKASDIARAETAEITVTNPAPGGGNSNVVFLPIREPVHALGMAADIKFSAPGSSTVVGDFNGDGKLDIAVGHTHNDGTGDIEIYLGKGDGTFRPPIKSSRQLLPLP